MARTPSLQLRLQLWLGGFMALLFSAFGFAIYRLETHAFYHQIDRFLDTRVSQVVRDFRNCEHTLLFERAAETGTLFPAPPPLPSAEPIPTPPRGNKGPPPPPNRRPVTLSDDLLKNFADDTRDRFAVWDGNGTLLASSSGALPPGGLPSPAASPSPPPASDFDTLRDTEVCHYTLDEWRIGYRFNEIGDCVLVAYNIQPAQTRLAREAMAIAAGVLASVILALGGIVLILRPALRPLGDISATARGIASGNLSLRIPPARHATPELANLSSDLNHAFANLDAAFARQRRFTADAAHELRTPIAVLLSETQLALRRDHTPEEYRETLQACEETAREMRTLTESLLQLARIGARSGLSDKGHAPLDLLDLVRKAADTLRPLAEAKDTPLVLPDAPCPYHGNRDQLLRLILNLAGNAIEYTPSGSRVRILLDRTPSAIRLSVADNGPGIAPDDLPHIFEPFYRASRSRTRDSGHSGIGLALCKAIAEAHGGTLSVSSPPGAGATFTATFPLS